MIELFMIRHAQASFGQPSYDQLSPLGEKQGQLLGRHFSKNGISFDAVYSGALKRQVQTASIVLAHMNARRSQKVAIDADFNEMDSSDQMMNRLFTVVREDPKLSEQMQHIHTDHGAIKRIFDIAEDLDVIPDDHAARTRRDRQFRERIHSAVDKIVRKGQAHKKVAVFTSGGPIAVALRRTLDTSREQTLRLGWALRNTSITVLRYDQRQLWLVLFNCVAHLEAQNNPGLLTYI